MIEILVSRRHKRLRDLLSAYIDGEVNGSEAARVEEHLSGCEECRRELDTLRATVELMGQLPELAPQRSYMLSAAPEPVRPGWTVTWTARAATSLAGLLVAALVLSDAFGIVTQRDARETASLPAAASAQASREIEEVTRIGETVIVEKEVIKAVMKATPPEIVAEMETVEIIEVVKEADAPVAQMAVPAPRGAPASREIEKGVRETPVEVVVESAVVEMIKDADAPISTMAAPVPVVATDLTQPEMANAPATMQVMAAPGDLSPAEAPTAAAERVAQDELARVTQESEAREIFGDGGTLSTPEPDGGLALPLWQLEVAAAALFLALVAATLWRARRLRRPWG